ncbi:aminotransferase class I/II-fold pyridoxal phosphate-dependent enzyme [Marinicella sp. W31]|uniref:aminotransferase class I/II-fold pyridoxal phosphate-dependent enzyme n=1 Tax=Marinicella sp. W31 TaxID=3023713 RepID=UPI003756FA5C
MSEFYQQLPAGLTNFHASNPEPFSVSELQSLVDAPVFAIPQDMLCHYDAVQGDLDLRKVIAQYVFESVKAHQIITTCGAQEAIFCLYHALLQPGDHVVTLTPTFEPLKAIPEHIGCRVTDVPLLPENDWQPVLDDINAAVNHNTKLLVINFPHNPTGIHIDEYLLGQIIDICKANDCWLFSDEVFRGLEHDPSTRLPAVADLYARGISLSVMSKAFALPAIRLGWLACQDQQLRSRLIQIKSQLSICNSRLDAHVSTHIIPHHEAIYKRNTDIINDNKQKLSSLISQYPDLQWVQPAGASTCFPVLKHIDSQQFTQKLIQTCNTLVLPKKLFLTENNGFRLALGFRNSQEKFEQIFGQTVI